MGNGNKKECTMQKRGKGIDRRDFLKGALATGTLSAAGLALAGCSPQASGGDGASASANASTKGGASVGLVGGAICAEDWLGEMPVVDEADVYDTVEVDVVVLGGGHAGTQAALSAAQNGASVAVVEVQDEKNYIYFGEDICSYNSQMFLEHGFGPYNVGDIVSEYTRRSVGRVSPSIIRLFVENSGEMMDNLVALTPDTSNAFDFDDDQCIIQVAYGDPSDDAYPMELSGYKTWPATFQTQGTVSNTQLIEGREEMSRITELETYCMREAQRLGAVWYWQHSAVALQLDGDAVLGAYAKGPDGKYLKLNAKKAVLLSSGDFSSNADMVYNLLDDVAEWSTRAGADRSALTGMGRDGAGHKLGCWAGGAIEPHPRPSMNTMGGMPGPWGTCPMLTLNAKGKRFMNEDLLKDTVEYSSAVLAQGGYAYTIVDQATVDRWADASYENTGSWIHYWDQNGIIGEDGERTIYHAPIDKDAFLRDFETLTATGDGIVANTIEEAAAFIGCSVEDLQNTIDTYNGYVKAGKDDQFFKSAEDLLWTVEEGPFYVTKGYNAVLGALGGVNTNELLQVVDSTNTPISGLYATGNNVSGMSVAAYVNIEGTGLGFALTSGRLAGANAAAASK